ncbi:MAG TPA: MarR family transcriptional regulator [Pseudonocardiaceae bacterium]
MTTAPTRCTADILMLLRMTAHALETELTARLAELGITPRAHCVLSKALDQERTQGELAELSNLDKTTMVVTVDTLELAGLAERRLSGSDRRARIIGVTDAGRRMVRRADQVVAGVYDDVLASLPAAERTAFVDGLTRLVHDRLAAPVPCDRPPRRRAARPPRSAAGVTAGSDRSVINRL